MAVRVNNQTSHELAVRDGLLEGRTAGPQLRIPHTGGTHRWVTDAPNGTREPRSFV